MQLDQEKITKQTLAYILNILKPNTHHVNKQVNQQHNTNE